MLEFFVKHTNAELRTLEHLHSKIYILDNFPIITSANLTYYGFYVNYESAVAGNNNDIERFEQIYDELWSLGEVINDENELKQYLEKSTYIDNEAYSPDVKTIKKLPKEFTQKCNYEQFLSEFSRLSEKYITYGRLWENTSLKYEIDSFLNFLFHHNQNHCSQEYYYINDFNKDAGDILLKICIQEYKEWINTKDVWDNEFIRENYKNNALKLFSDDNINNVSIGEISDFLQNNINTYLTNSVRFDWGNKFKEKNNIETVKNFIKKLKNSTPKELDKLLKASPISYMGESTLSELLGLIREDLPIRNENTNAGLRYLGYKV